jgi:hypothetical protein
MFVVDAQKGPEQWRPTWTQNDMRAARRAPRASLDSSTECSLGFVAVAAGSSTSLPVPSVGQR